MTSHLLPLSTIAATLPVLFGPDGDFPGAPVFAGPLTSSAMPGRYGWLVWRGALAASIATDDGHWPVDADVWPTRWVLDLRVPSVAARMAGLCARALGLRFDAALVDVTGTAKHGFVVLRGFRGLSGEDRRIWSRATGAELSETPTGVTLTPAPESAAEALAALFLTLAPRIAALGGAQ